MSTNIFKTGLYPVYIPVGADAPIEMFYVKSNCIKVYPASWRNADIQADEQAELTSDIEVPKSVSEFSYEDKQIFNIESVLNTEHNITNRPGPKNFIISCDKTDTGIYANIRFFINGYAVEIYNLDLSGIKESNKLNLDDPSTINLYASIRTLAQVIGDNELDYTQVLVPYGTTNTEAPIFLDQQVNNYYAGQFPEGGTFNYDNLDKEIEIGSAFNGGVITKDDFLFTGIAFSFDPDVFYSAPSTLGETQSIYTTMQIIKEDSGNREYYAAAVSCGNDDNESAVVLGKGEGIISDIENMVAMGAYNTTTYTAANGINPGEQTVLSVGAGTRQEPRNAFEVTAGNISENSQDYFETNIRSGAFRVRNASELVGKGSEVSGVYTINRGLKVAEDGSWLEINSPYLTDGNSTPEIVRNSAIGINSYGNINILGSKLNFKDTEIAGETARTVATMSIGDLVNGNIVSDRGLLITGVSDINHGALVFKMGSVVGGNTLDTINNNITIAHTGRQISIDTGDGILKIGSDSGSNSGKPKISGLRTIEENTNGTTINNLTIHKATSATGQVIDGVNIFSGNDIRLASHSSNLILDAGRKIKLLDSQADPSDLEAAPAIDIFRTTKDCAVINLPSSLTIDPETNIKDVYSGSSLYGVSHIARRSFSQNDDPKYGQDHDDARIVLDTDSILLATGSGSTANKFLLADTSYIDSNTRINVEAPIVDLSANDLYLDSDRTYVEGDLMVDGNVRILGTCTFDKLNLAPNADFKRLLLTTLYPVGSIYMTTDSRTPYDIFELASTHWQWERYAKGRTIFGVDSSNEYFKEDVQNGTYQASLPEHSHGLNQLNVEFTSSSPSTDDSASTNFDKVLSVTSATTFIDMDTQQTEILGLAKTAAKRNSIFKESSTESDKKYGGDYENINFWLGRHGHFVNCSAAGSDNYTGVEGNAGDNGVSFFWTGAWNVAGTASGRTEHDQGYAYNYESEHGHISKSIKVSGTQHSHDISHTHTLPINFIDKKTDSAVNYANNTASVAIDPAISNVPPYVTCYIWKRVG